MDDAAFGANLRALRCERGLTQDELAARVGCGDKRHVSYLENGHRDPHLSTLRRIAAALDVGVAALVAEREREAINDHIY